MRLLKLHSHVLKAALGLGLGLGWAVCGVVAHQHGDEAQVPLHEQEFVQDSAEELERKWSFEVGLRFFFARVLGRQVWWGYSGVNSFAHLEHIKCLAKPESLFDIAILGVPFDTAVSYRPGARFGPRAIRAASARQNSFRGFNARAGINPFLSWAKIIDCGDIPTSPFDNAVALTQMTAAYLELGHRAPLSSSLQKPKIISLGGDHSLALPALRGLNKVYGGPIAVLHFDAHLDTWHPAKYPTPWPSQQAEFNHGSMFWIASNEGLILNGSSVHAGLRTRLSGPDWGDYDDDDTQGFLRIAADDIDDFGPRGVIEKIMKRMGSETPVYLSVDID
ncbi:Guanidinobutyrase, partial [Lachnellula willkommii]